MVNICTSTDQTESVHLSVYQPSWSFGSKRSGITVERYGGAPHVILFKTPQAPERVLSFALIPTPWINLLKSLASYPDSNPLPSQVEAHSNRQANGLFRALVSFCITTLRSTVSLNHSSPVSTLKRAQQVSESFLGVLSNIWLRGYILIL